MNIKIYKRGEMFNGANSRACYFHGREMQEWYKIRGELTHANDIIKVPIGSELLDILYTCDYNNIVCGRVTIWQDVRPKCQITLYWNGYKLCERVTGSYSINRDSIYIDCLSRFCVIKDKVDYSEVASMLFGLTPSRKRVRRVILTYSGNRCRQKSPMLYEGK